MNHERVREDPSSSGSTTRASPKASQGQGRGCPKALDARHLAPSKDQRSRSPPAPTAAQLNRWFDRAITAGTANEGLHR